MAEQFGAGWEYQVIIVYISKSFQQLFFGFKNIKLSYMGLKTEFHEFKNEKGGWWWDKKVQQIVENYGACWAYQFIIFYLSKTFQKPSYGFKNLILWI